MSEGTLEEHLRVAIDKLPPDGVTLSEIRDLVGSDGLMLLVALLTLVFMVPISIPGVSTVFGGGILLIGISRLFRRNLWLPDRLARRVVSTEKLRGGLQRGLIWFRRLERVSRPGRLPGLTSDGLAGLITNLAIILAAVLLMAPFGLIPLSNTLPAIALLFFAIGVLQRDGICILLGHCANIVTIVYFGLLIGGGGLMFLEGLQRMIG